MVLYSVGGNSYNKNKMLDLLANLYDLIFSKKIVR